MTTLRESMQVVKLRINIKHFPLCINPIRSLQTYTAGSPMLSVIAASIYILWHDHYSVAALPVWLVKFSPDHFY